MKKLSLTLLLTAFLVALTSCDVLDTEPQTSLDAATALSDGASAEAILLGAYSRMQVGSYYGIEYTLNNDLIADNARYQGFFDSQLELDSGNVPISNLWIGNAWVNIYRVVNIANQLIESVPNIEDDAFATRDQVLGEAHAIRALAYFDLLRVFGEHYDLDSNFGMPLLLDPIENNDFNLIPDLTRSTVQETYQQILSDINTALPLMEGYVDNTRLSYWSTLALRARINLYRQDYTSAYNDADDVINSGAAALEEDLDDVYLTTSTSSESLFDLVFSDQDQSSYYTFAYQRDEYNVDPSLTEAFEDGDLRRNYIEFVRGSDRPVKWSDPNNANNAKIIRLAEMYLIRSEAAVYRDDDPNAGLDDLNTIRNRADLDDIGPFTTVEEYADALLQERRIELNYEGHRFFDLVRFDKIGDVLGMDEFRKILPIPRDELLATDNLNQNPGFPTE